MHRTLRNFYIFFLLLAFVAPHLLSQTRLAVPSYQTPGSSVWNKWATNGPASVGIMVVDLGNGDDQTYHSSVANAISQAQLKGIYVLGYTYTSYGARDPRTIHQRIDSLYQNYMVDGIFFDETTTDCDAHNQYQPNNFLYYEELTNYVRQRYAGARLTVMNPGTNSPSDCWMSITNILVNWENTGFANYANNYIDYPWVHKYPADRFWHVLLGVPQASLQASLSLAQARNAGWIYVSDSATNAYNQTPAYWSTEATLIAQQGIQAPHATSWPDSVSSTGALQNGRTSFRWRSLNGTIWQIFLDCDKDAATGYHHAGLSVGAEYMVQSSALGGAHLYHYSGSGADWSWAEVQANAQFVSPDTGINLVMVDTSALSTTSSLTYQIESLDSSYNLLSASYSLPLNTGATSFDYDILNHTQ